jgi:actin-related protein
MGNYKSHLKPKRSSKRERDRESFTIEVDEPGKPTEHRIRRRTIDQNSGDSSDDFVKKINRFRQSRNDLQCVVVDNGSSRIVSGFAGGNPKNFVPNLIGKLNGEKSKIGDMEYDDLYDYTSPISNGIIQNWDEMVEIWDYTFHSLNISIDEHPVLMTEALHNDKYNREKLVEIMFERFNVRGFYLAPATVLSLYGSGRSTGISLNIGEDLCECTTVYEGYPISQTIYSSTVSGRQMTDYMKFLLNENEHHIPNSLLGRKISNGVKESLGYVAANYQDELATSSMVERDYEFPNGSTKIIGAERFQVPELLFNPNINGLTELGIHEIVNNSILDSADLKDQLYQEITVSGRTTLFPGFLDRLNTELKILNPNKTIKISGRPERGTAPFMGGSIVGCLPTLCDMMIDSHKYDEKGTSVIHQFCF